MSSSQSSVASFTVFDIGKFVSDHHKNSCSKGILFLSSPVAKASREDNQRLRDEFAIVTLVDTQLMKDIVYRIAGESPNLYLPDAFFVQKLLGLTLYQVHLRLGEYGRDLLNGLPAKISRAMIARASKSGNPNNAETKRQFQSQILTRNSVEDSFAVLTMATEHIGLLFNTVFNDPQSYPLLLAGDNLLRDNSILVFLLLVLLDIPVEIIDRIHCTMLEAAPIDETFLGTEVGSGLYTIWMRDKASWAKRLKDRLYGHYGGITEYLVVVGVSKATQQRVVQLLQGSEDHPGRLNESPPPSYELSLS